MQTQNNKTKLPSATLATDPVNTSQSILAPSNMHPRLQEVAPHAHAHLRLGALGLDLQSLYLDALGLQSVAMSGCRRAHFPRAPLNTRSQRGHVGAAATATATTTVAPAAAAADAHVRCSGAA